ncbi:MAG TPA: hypothetical protein VHK67_06405 [Rhabdochlamydiaceae bacterium]|jgi:hypothetical protein|nr:hypothetical protein [Rhabdochlamydiaceae bacterium]
MELTKRAWLIISGIKWFAIGAMLLTRGLRLITAAADQAAIEAPFIKFLQSFASSRHQAALLIVCLGLFVGFIKGRTVLAKTVNRIASRINLHPERLTLKQAYDQRYWIVIVLMMVLGMSFRALSVPFDIRGGVDVAIGSALINGAMLYFRHTLAPRKT